MNTSGPPAKFTSTMAAVLSYDGLPREKLSCIGPWKSFNFIPHRRKFYVRGIDAHRQSHCPQRHRARERRAGEAIQGAFQGDQSNSVEFRTEVDGSGLSRAQIERGGCVEGRHDLGRAGAAARPFWMVDDFA